MSMSNTELEVAGYQQVFEYTQYSHSHHVNVIPKQDFQRLVSDTFQTLTNTLRETFGPYASTVMISSDTNETITTKDGYNVFTSMGFSHTYMNMVYLILRDIIERVNKRVGDGTTSCMLLAEKMFNELEKFTQTCTPDEQKAIMDVLTNIEKDLQSIDKIDRDRDRELIKPLDKKSLYGLIRLAANYDDELTENLYRALDPVFDENDNVVSTRNVVVEPKLEHDGDSTTHYDNDFLPGDYRIRVHMEDEAALLFEEPRKIRVALYDHAFTSSDWNFFMEKFDKETETLIIARDFNSGVLNNEFVRYCKDRRLTKSPIKILFCQCKGNYFKNEIKDLAAVLDTETIGLHAKAVEHEELPVATIQIHKGNCMCFFTDHVPHEHIKHIKAEMDAELSNSMIKRSEYMNRIEALSLKNKDTLITVTSGTSLELKMISDKLDDCVSIVKSAMEFGVVPNMLVYGFNRINELKSDDELMNRVCDAITTAIRGLFKDIWKSKHGSRFEDKQESISNEIYDFNMQSFDIIGERFVDIHKLPTSAQYDIEVIVAAISIVKYLLTSSAFVFSTQTMTKVNDIGHYERM